MSFKKGAEYAFDQLVHGRYIMSEYGFPASAPSAHRVLNLDQSCALEASSDEESPF